MKKMKKYFIILLIAFISINNVVLLAQYPLTARAKNGMVVSANQLASEVGIQILKKGGNAIDAAVATGFALAVTYPFAGNIGGGGFMVIQFENGKNTAIDFREKAPLTAHRDMYLDEKGNYIPSLSQEGATSVAVPGSVSGLIYALEKYGTKSLSEVIQPAIELAKKGWKLDYRTAQSFNANKKEFEKYSSSKKIFVKDKPWKEGDLFVQKDLAKTLEVIKKNGKSGFYKGKVADLLINQINSLGGKISQKDLDLYNVVEKEPVKGTYKGYEILSMPPSSSGGIALIEILNILENFKIDKDEWGSSEYIHKLVEAMKYAYADRAEYLGDDKFYNVPQKILTSKEYAKLISEKIKQNFGKAVPSNEIDRSILKNFKESNETTHYSVIDKYGNAVSVTTTINSAYGSKIVVEDAGFLLNNEMDDFSAKPGEANQFGLVGNEANSIQPQKRPLSSMTPTIVLKNGKPYIVIGSPGGSRIITTVLQVILNCLEFDMNIADAINSPRIHHQWLPDKIYIEQFALSNDVMKRLMEMGYQFEDANNKFTILGLAEGILVDQNKNIFNGAADKRGAGAAIGY
jgi:gamma-glutamyltranspeptidase/glutathione hydrolase